MNWATKTSRSASSDRQGQRFHTIPSPDSLILSELLQAQQRKMLPSFLPPPCSPLLPAPVPDFRKECHYYKLDEQRACPFLGQAFFFFEICFPIISPSSHYTFMWICFFFFFKNIFLTIFTIDDPQGCPV